MTIRNAADVKTGDKIRILNVNGIDFANNYFQDGDVVEAKVAPTFLFGMPIGDYLYLVPADVTQEELAQMGDDGLIVLEEELHNIEKVADDTPLSPRHKVEGLGNSADEITLDGMFDDGNAHMYTPKFKKGERVQTLPGASYGTASVKDGEVYEIGEVTYVGEGDFLYRMGADAGNFVCEDEITKVESVGLGNHAIGNRAKQIEVGDTVRLLPGGAEGTQGLVDGEIYKVYAIVPFLGDTFYDLTPHPGNGVYGFEIELVEKGSK